MIPVTYPENRSHRENLQRAVDQAVNQKIEEYRRAGAPSVEIDLVVRKIMVENDLLVREAGEMIFYDLLFDELRRRYTKKPVDAAQWSHETAHSSQCGQE